MEESSEIRNVLEKEFKRRVRDNPRYSLRAFARALNVSPSVLSKILTRKRRVTQVTFEKFAKNLGWANSEYERLRPQQKLRRRKKGEAVVPEFMQISSEDFGQIADWYNSAINQMVLLKHFRPDVRWIARALRITSGTVELSKERMLKLGLIRIDSDGTWKLHPKRFLYRQNRTHEDEAFLKLEKQILKKGIQALSEEPNRCQTVSMTLPIDPSRLEEAKFKMEKFRNELCEFLMDGRKNLNEVYHLSFSLFPVTRFQDGAVEALESSRGRQPKETFPNGSRSV